MYNWYYYNNVYTQDEMRDIHKTILEKSNPKLTDNPARNKRVNTIAIDTNLIRDKLDPFFDTIHRTNETKYGFDVYGDPRTINLNSYDIGDEYPYHLDGCEGIASIKLTAILNLSTEPYEGGELQIFDGVDTTVDIKSGSMVIFPSYMWHRVLPVTSGKRVSMSCWYYGPHWR